MVLTKTKVLRFSRIADPKTSSRIFGGTTATFMDSVFGMAYFCVVSDWSSSTIRVGLESARPASVSTFSLNKSLTLSAATALKSPLEQSPGGYKRRFSGKNIRFAGNMGKRATKKTIPDVHVFFKKQKTDTDQKKSTKNAEVELNQITKV